MKAARAFLCAAVFVAACSDEVVPPPDSPGIVLSELCAELAKTDCDRLERCGTLIAPFDKDLCIERQQRIACAPVVAGISAAVDAGSMSYFELAARECRSAVGDQACAVGLDWALLGLPACRAMLESKGGAGAACAIPEACADGHYCAVTNGCPGSCKSYAGINESCSGVLCAARSYCAATGMRCLASVDLNQACGISIQGNSCLPGAFCDMSNPASPACRPVRGRGQGCQTNFECAAGASCIANRCSAGEPNDGCTTGADCRVDLRCFGGRCVAPGAPMTDCMPSGAPCAEGLSCTSSAGATKCFARGLTGDRCADAAACYLSSCVAGTCAALASDGDACTAAGDCLPGRTCTDQRCVVQPSDCRP